MTDDRFERELRGFLAGRAPATVSPVLRARLQAVTAEPASRSGGRLGRFGGAGRLALGLATTAAAAILLVAVLARAGGLTIRDPGAAGGPSAAPGVPAAPFVSAPTGLFTPGAVADAERRLEAVYAATGVEATIILQPDASTTQVSAPDGWPERYDRDGDPDRDILAVIGIAPDGSPVCCLTLAGDLIERAQAEGYWRPMDQPGALDGDLAAATAEFRDVALERFVRGIEDMAPGIATLESEVLSRDTFWRAVGLVAIIGPLLLFALVTLRRRSAAVTIAAGSRDGDIDVEVPAAITPATGVAAPSTRPTQSDRSVALVSLAAITGLALLGVIDLLLPAPTSVRLDPTRDGIGLATPGLNILPLALLATALAGLVAYARRAGWRRRIGVLILVLVVGWATSIVVDAARPTTPDRDRGWVAGENGEVTWRGMGGLQEQVTFGLEPGEPFTFTATVRNPGLLPVTILGLDGAQATEPNSYVASVVGLGWVVQPTDGDRINYLSARPEDASASWPITLGPGEELAIVLLGRAGPCAQPGGTGSVLPLGHIDLAYRVLGFERSTQIGLPAVLSFPAKDPCTVQIPGGTVTYSTP